MTIALQLDASGYSALQAEAHERGMTPEQLANEIVQRHLRTRASAEDPAFRAALAASMKENEELLRRLAK